MNKVLIYRSEALPYSETFIKEQALSLYRWKGVLVADRAVRDGLSLEGIKVILLRDSEKGAFLQKKAQLAREIIFKTLNTPDIGSIAKLRAEHASLFHAHFATNAANIWPIVRKLGLPMVITLHGSDINLYKEYWESGQGGKLMLDYPVRLLKLAQENNIFFIAVSEAIRNRAIEYGIPANKITVRYIGVDTERFCPCGLPIQMRAQRILYIGRLVEKKGCNILINAVSRLQKDIPKIELAIAGDGPLSGQLELLSKERGLNVTFLGSLTAEQVRAELHLARVLCLPSITAVNGDAEGFGMVILEAQACGVPVVSSARGGASEGIINGISGFSFPEGDVGILTERLRTLLTDDELAQEMSSRGIRFVSERFDIRKCTQELESYYDSIMESGAFSP